MALNTAVDCGTLITVRENTDVSAARRALLRTAQISGFSDQDAGNAAIAATEAASNLIKHAGGGEFLVHRTRGDTGYGVEFVAIDKGPGIANIPRSFRDGYSTAGSAGTGLGAISRLSRFCSVYSRPNAGMILLAQFGPEPGVKAGLHLGILTTPYPGEEFCGDTVGFHHSADRFRVILADGLGHGVFASEASQAAVRDIAEPRHVSPSDVVEGAHLRLKATRGAAASVADIHFAQGWMDFAGVGNVAGSIVEGPAVRRQMICMNGTLGHEVRSVRQYRSPLMPSSLVILHSDGLSTMWSLEQYPGLFQQHPSVVAAVLFRDFRRTRDDASIVVVKNRLAAQ